MSLKCRYMSDLHLEFMDWKIPPHEDDKDTVLILAGDINVKGRVVLPASHDVENKDQTVYSWIGEYVERYKAIVIILGNHDCWGVDMERIHTKINAYIEGQGWRNVHVLEKAAVVIDGVAFIGATFWTDMNGGDGRARYRSEQTSMNYRKIKYKISRKVNSKVLELHHILSKKYIEEYCTANPSQKKVLITHQPPLVESWYKSYPDSVIEWDDVSDCGDWLSLLNGVEIVCHGHLHKTLNYFYKNRRILCNPRGYYGHGLNTDFDAFAYFEI